MTDGRIVDLKLVPLNLSMRQPFVTALGNKSISRNLLVALHLEDGTVGLGEASASLAWPLETQPAMKSALESLKGRLMGSPIHRFRYLADTAWKSAGEHPTAVAALECALLDAYTRRQNIPLWRFLGGKRRSVTTSFTISAWAPNQVLRVASALRAAGFRYLKVKVTGRNLDEDLRRVRAVHQIAPKATLWIDGNQGFSVKEALRFASTLRRYSLPVQLFEQPVARENWEGLGEVQREGKIPVAADESARSVSETLRLLRKKIVRIINIKIAKCGLFGTLEIIRMAKRNRTSLMIGCMAESAIGLSASVHLACGTGSFRFVDLDSHLLVVSPPCDSGFQSHGDRLTVHPRRPGCGVLLPG